jgi:basic membrane protein A
VPGIRTINGYSQDFVAQDKCKNIALNQIAHGSKVVFQVAGGCGLGVLDAAKERRVWGIGVDADQSYVNDYVLTSAVKRVDVAVFTAIENVAHGRFTGGGNLVFDASNGGVGIGKINPRVPQSLVAATMAVARKVAAGDVQPPTTCSGGTC